MGINYTIKRIDELGFVDNNIFGNKVAYLAEAKKNGLLVPNGFCICFKNKGKRIDFKMLKKDIQQTIGGIFENDVCYIVRSSAQYEDGKGHNFPGIFKSKRNIKTWEELLEAIKECYQSQFLHKVKLYTEYVNFNNMQQDYFCVLVQEQINPDYSGVLFTTNPVKEYCENNTYLVEMAMGHCQNMLQGKEKANSFVIKKLFDRYQIQESHSSISLENEVIKKVLQELGEETECIIRIFGKKLDIEWGYINGKIVIFQIRPELIEREIINIHQEDHAMYGVKAEAMQAFSKMGLFQKKLLIIKAGTDVDEVIERVKENVFSNPQITIRFSCENELGLPRYFAPNKEDGIAYIKKNYNPKWTIIIHESIQVVNSYELYIDEKKSILEHIPGMWESDVQIRADAWVYLGETVKAFICNESRIAKYEDSTGIEYENFAPYTEIQAIEIAKKMNFYIKRIKKYWSVEGGINFHFVCDNEGKIYFLNQRKSKEITFLDEKVEEMIEICSKDDITKWDGRSSIVLRVDLKRGQEALLEDFVPFLKNTGVKIYVEFGILSHPAILLREMGVSVSPLYSKHQQCEFVLPSLDTYTMS